MLAWKPDYRFMITLLIVELMSRNKPTQTRNTNDSLPFEWKWFVLRVTTRNTEKFS